MNGTDSQSYRETSVSDSQVSFSEHALDSDFDTQPTKKKRKPNPPAGKQASKRHGSKAPARTTRLQAHPVQQQSDAQLTEATNSKKRKVAVADIIDPASASLPPSKRQALESTVKRAHVGSKLRTADPTHPATQTTRDTTNDSAQAISYIRRPTNEELGGRSYGYTDLRVKPLQKAGTSQVQEASAPSAEEVTALDMVKDIGSLMAVFMQEQKATSGLTKEVERRLRIIRRTVEQQPGELLEKLIGDLHSADSIHADMIKLVHDLVGHRDLDNKKKFPEPTDTKNVDKRWKAFRQYIQDSFGHYYPEEPLAKAEDAGYVAARINDLAKNMATSETESIKQFLEELEPCLQSPYLVQSIIAALLCHWLFSGPEPMCHDVYSPKETKLYESLLFSSESPCSWK
jgi:hypothetical protein